MTHEPRRSPLAREPGAAKYRSVGASPATSLSSCPIGVVPIVWNNTDLPDLRETVDTTIVLDEIARLGFDGCQYGVGFPRGPVLRQELERRGIRLAEVYASVPCGRDGPTDDAWNVALDRLEIVKAANGDMLVVALDIDPVRSSFAARSDDPSCPVLSEKGWEKLGELIEGLSNIVGDQGPEVSFHPHVGTYIEGAAECARLVEILRQTSMGLCLDVGHWLLGGGDPRSAIRAYGDVIRHVHLKDVDSGTLDELAEGRLSGFEAALRRHVFTELGGGLLDVFGVLESLEVMGYNGWLMIEQDTTSRPPAESAAVGLHTARFAMRALGT